MIPALVAMLVKNNLPKVAQAVTEKGLDYVQGKLGISLKPEMTPEELAAVRERAMQHTEFMVEAHNKNTADARAMQAVALGQDDLLSKRFVYYLSAFWSIAAVIYIAFITFGTIPEDNVRFADTILGFLLGTVVATILNFFLGSSDGSKRKDEKGKL